MATDSIYGDIEPPGEVFHPKERPSAQGYKRSQERLVSSPFCQNRNGICAPGSCQCRRNARPSRTNYCEKSRINDDCCYKDTYMQNNSDFLHYMPPCNNEKCIAAGVCQCNQRFNNCGRDKEDTFQCNTTGLPECPSYTYMPPSDCQCWPNYKRCDSGDCPQLNNMSNFGSKPTFCKCNHPMMNANCDSLRNKPNGIKCNSIKCIGLDRCTCNTGNRQSNNNMSPPPWGNCCMQSNVTGFNENFIKNCPNIYSSPAGISDCQCRKCSCDLCQNDRPSMRFGNENACSCCRMNCFDPFRSTSQQNFSGCNQNRISSNNNQCCCSCSCSSPNLQQYHKGNCCSCNDNHCSKGCSNPPIHSCPSCCCNSGPTTMGNDSRPIMCNCNSCCSKNIQDSFSQQSSSSRCNNEFSESPCNKECQTMDSGYCLADNGFGCIGSYGQSNCSLTRSSDCPRCNTISTSHECSRSDDRPRGGCDTENSSSYRPNNNIKDSIDDYRRSCYFPPLQDDDYFGKVNDFNIGLLRAGSEKRPRLFARKFGGNDTIIKPASGNPSLYFFSHQEKSTIVNRVN